MDSVRVEVTRINPHDERPLPSYQTAGASGLDLLADIAEKLSISPFERVLVPTGIALAIPSGYEGQIRPRSGLALKQGLTCLNSPGTIDSDYRGEIKVLLVNLSSSPTAISRGDRIAQLVVSRVARAHLVDTGHLSATERGAGGFGSTGVGTTP